MDDDVFAKPGTVASRHFWVWLAGIGVLFLTARGLGGCFMEGEDELDSVVPWLVVFGGGVAGERLHLACQLFSQGHGHQGVVLTGANLERFTPDRAALIKGCGVPGALLHQWPTLADSFQELSAVATIVSAKPGARAAVVSDALHMPRLRYLQARLALNGRMYLRQRRLGGRLDPDYLFWVVIFWFREPLAYGFYRLRY